MLPTLPLARRVLELSQLVVAGSFSDSLWWTMS
ncbi:hypothetical protein SVIOM342S_05997 [Streptomyces violaceorubidus]